MAKCRNDECNQDAMKSINKIRVSIDGDFVCDSDCERMHEAQKSKFFNETIHNEDLFKEYLLGN